LRETRIRDMDRRTAVPVHIGFYAETRSFCALAPRLAVGLLAFSVAFLMVQTLATVLGS